MRKKNSVKKTWTRPRKKELAEEKTHQESVHEKKNSFKKYALVQEGVQEIKNSFKKKKIQVVLISRIEKLLQSWRK